MQLGKVKEPQGVGTTGPGLMQEVKEEKSGEAERKVTEKADRGLVGAEKTARKLPPGEGNRKATPSSPPSLTSPDAG